MSAGRNASDERCDIMVDTKMTVEHPEKQFWDELDKVHAVMLGLEGMPDHMQPMAPFGDPAGERIWFFSRKSSDLVDKIGAGTVAHMTLVGKHHDYHACTSGRIARSGDVSAVEKYWNPVVAAWYEHGKDDPDLALLEYVLEDGAVWGSSNSSLKFSWEIAKANIKDEAEPHIGERNHLHFASKAA